MNGHGVCCPLREELLLHADLLHVYSDCCCCLCLCSAGSACLPLHVPVFMCPCCTSVVTIMSQQVNQCTTMSKCPQPDWACPWRNRYTCDVQPHRPNDDGLASLNPMAPCKCLSTRVGGTIQTECSAVPASYLH